MALECIKGTDIPIVDVVKRAKSVYLFNRFEGHDAPFGMCEGLLRALRNMVGVVGFVSYHELSNYIPLFCRHVAKTRFGADANANKTYWWPANEPAKRLEYFNWLIEQYSKEI